LIAQGLRTAAAFCRSTATTSAVYIEKREVRMSMPPKPATPSEDEAPPPPGDVWMEPVDDLEELEENHDDEITRPGGPVVGGDDEGDFDDSDDLV
jgi:hypothetical protein